MIFEHVDTSQRQDIQKERYLPARLFSLIDARRRIVIPLRIDARSRIAALRVDTCRRARGRVTAPPMQAAQDVLEPVERGTQPALRDRQGGVGSRQRAGTGYRRYDKKN
jgi:hypothetical protein